MSGKLIVINPRCIQCDAPLTIDEMHYYDQGNGSATCNTCEGKWMEEVEKWRRAEVADFPCRNTTNTKESKS